MEPADIRQFLEGAAPFRYLTDAELTKIGKAIRVAYYPADSIFAISPDQLLIIRSGIFSLLDQQRHRQAQLQTGDCAGHESLLGLSGGSDEMICDEDGLIFWLGRQAFLDCLQSNLHFAGYFHGLARRVLHQYRDPQSSPRFLQKISDLIRPIKIAIAPGRTVQDAALLMSENRVSSLLVEADHQLIGIVTDRDLRNRVLARGLSATTAVSAIMTASPYCIEKSAYLFEAVQLMSRHNIHHLPVTDRGIPCGMITLTDVVRAQKNHPLYVISDIHRQTTVAGLHDCARQVRPLLEELGRQQAPAHEVAHIITTVTDALTQQLVQLALSQFGPAPCRFSWLGFGSQARMDQSINADQDNALLLAEEPEGAIEIYFARLADFVCSGLAQCGIPLCPGNIMATNPELRLSVDGWMRKFSHFIQTPDPVAVLGSSIFFDMRVIAGDHTFIAPLRQHIQVTARHNDLFFFQLARAALERTPPLSMLRNFVLEKTAAGETGIDLKKRGISIITDIVRVYAVAEGITAINTRERLQQLMKNNNLDAQDGQNLQDAFDVIAQVRWHKHQSQLAQSEPPSNLVDPATLHALQREQLKDSFLAVSRAQAALKSRFCRTL